MIRVQQLTRLLAFVVSIACLNLLVSPRLNLGAAQADTLSGKYQLSGSEQDGTSYTGSLTITPSASDQARIPTFTLVWDVDGEQYTGFGILHDDVLSAVYGDDGCALLTYKFRADGGLIGVYANIVDHRFGTESVPAREKLSPHNFVGTVPVEGVSSDGAYKANMTVAGSGLVYAISWDSADGPHGVSLFEGNSLSVEYKSDESECELVSFTVRDNGTLTGIYADEQTAGLGTELAVRLEPSQPVSATP